MRPHRLPVVGFLVASLLGAPLSAQQFPGFGSLEGRVGLVFPDEADAGFGVAVDIGLGFFGSPTLRTFVGFHFFDADVSYVRVPGSPSIDGSISATGGRVGVRLDPFGAAAIGPYLLAAVTAHNVTIDAPTEGARIPLDDVFGGFVVGGSLGGGVTYALDFNQRFLATGEVRRVFVANIPHWSGEVGVRIVPRGRAAYDPVVRFQDPWAVAPVTLTPEAERLRLERQRLEAAQLAEQERLTRMTEEERRAFLAAEEARQRAEADAATRAATDTEMERVRRESAEARAAAEAAERRAREAEDRLYRTLLDLDRLIANVTAIRETERGLTIALGEGLFAVGQHTLSPRARDEVQRIAAVLLQFPQYPISVEGHTDSTGSLAMNQQLAEQRAHAVRAGLVAEGVDPNRVGVVGHGPLLPIADNATVAGRAQNRRVEIILLGAQRPAAQVIR